MGNSREQFAGLVNKINEKNPYILVVAILSLLLIVFYLFPLQFQLATLQSLNPRLETLTRDVENARNNIQRVPQYKKELERVEVKLKQLQRRIRTKEEVPFLLENISRIAGKYGVRIGQIMPQTAIDKPVLENVEGRYYSVPIIMEAQSGYHAFGKFLNELEREGIFLRLPSFSITGNPADPRYAGISLSMELVIFEKK